MFLQPSGTPKHVMMPRKRRVRHRALKFGVYLIAIATSLFLFGLEMWELWMAMVILYYLFWILRRD